jgi:GNAT superfamily N-acetyltransferase
MPPPLTFEKLFREENCLLSHADQSSTKQTLEGLDVEPPGPAGEPWIRSTPVDRVGLAFSGGGIRSATFNLGVLKALHELHLLRHVDYLSTVSGGGYVGAWWSAWRARVGREFPEAQTTSQRGTSVTQAEMNREPDEVRHLREFSNFLSPRIGFFQSEMWNAVIAVLSALVPAIVVTSAVMALAFLLWLGVSSLILFDALNMPISPPKWLQAVAGCLNLAPPGPLWLTGWLAPTVLSLSLIALHLSFERHWRGLGKAEQPSSKKVDRRVHGVLLTVVTACIIIGWFGLNLLHWPGLRALESMNVVPKTGPPSWVWATSIGPPQNPDFSFSPTFSPYLFAGPILWAALAILLFVPRLVIMGFLRERAGTLVSTIDRALSRLLGVAVVLSALAALWLAGCWINYTNWGVKLSAGGALASGGAFALLRNWMGRLGPGKKGGIMDMVKPLIPQVLAYVAIALWAICVAALLAHWLNDGTSSWVLFAVVLGIVLFALAFFDAAQVSMHSFYRNRLSRAYLGASNIDATTSLRVYAKRNRQTDLRWHDDIELCALSPTAVERAADRTRSEKDRVYAEGREGTGKPSSRVRPLHLVCCAANDLGGDHLENLSRGSRSAVLSKFGFSIGNYWKAWRDEKREKGEDHPTLGLGSAITASAAAFNSNMGSLSMTLGAGVTFLCTALNLRLGLWLPHPLSAKYGAPPITPGWLFLKEMFGLTNSGLQPGPPDQLKPVAEYVHLSDGAHFENLALYELVRRHCRYIIVSDCGADPEVTFDDFGNAVRRIREDFGVEIEIDLSPLKPDAEQRSKQHVAVGTISYDPRGNRKDSAILLYFKPALTGDEPCDITQYRTRNKAFPHESTGDQFYDEAQWESYRRLGEHATRSALRFVERMSEEDAGSADAVFSGARWEWYQSPSRHADKILELTGRLSVLEQQLRQDAPSNFVREMYPELIFFGDEKEDVSAKPTKSSPKEISKTLHFLTQMIQLMEDVWFGSELEVHWNDPNNLGWMNTFQRWAYTPSFRLWWPILKPMYGRKFRRFMEERLSLADEDYPKTMANVNKWPGTNPPDGVAQVYWKRMHAAQESEEGPSKEGYSFDLTLTDQRLGGTHAPVEVQAGLAFLDLSDKPTARWNVEDFFVPPSLWGAGLGAIFLKKLLDELESHGFTRCEVTVETPLPKKADDEAAVPWNERTDMASRQQLNDLLTFYQRENFRLETKKLIRTGKSVNL